MCAIKSKVSIRYNRWSSVCIVLLANLCLDIIEPLKKGCSPDLSEVASQPQECTSPHVALLSAVLIYMVLYVAHIILAYSGLCCTCSRSSP